MEFPIIISSGYRPPALNKAVNGATNSWHQKGLAADIACGVVKNRKIYDWLQEKKNKGEIPEKYTPKQMASFNLYWNKHMMEEYKFSPKVRVMIYHLIDLKIKSDVKPDEKSKALMVETNNFNVYFIAKISNGITLYRITKIEKKHPGI